MPSFESPLPYSPDRTNIWPQSVYKLRVDGLPTRSDSTARIQATYNFHATLPVNPHTHVRIQPFGQTNWNAGAQAGYFIDRLPAGTDVSFASSARRTWTANNPDAEPSGKHLYFSDLRQQGATKNLLTGDYTILPTFVQNDKHAVMWSPESDELVEAISYRGDRPESSHAVTWITTDYEMALGRDLVRKAGATATRFPVAPLYFTYQDLIDAGTTGDLGHLLGFTMEDGDQNYVWPARANDFTGDSTRGLAEGMILRLRADFDENVFTSPQLRVIARTLKKHGAVIFDRGPVMRIATCNDPTWPSGLSADWGTKVSILDFEVVDPSSVIVPSWTRNYPLEPPAGTFRVGISNQTDTSKHETPTGQPLGLIRKTYTWANRLNCLADIEVAARAGRAIHLSFDTPVWSAVAAGSHDVEFNALFAAIRDTSTCVWVSFAAEPEAMTGQGSATDWRNMQARIVARRDSSSAVNAQVVPVLKAETVASGAASTWVIESATFPIYGLDFYSTGYSTSPTNLRANTTFQTAVDYLTSRNIDICFPEVGCYEATPTTPTLPALDITGDVVPPSNYPAPSGAIYVSPSGNNANAGTLASPKRTVFGSGGAYNATPSGGTIVMRAGTYEEGTTGGGYSLPTDKHVTIQAYPGEQVWFDGSTVVTGWTGTGPYTKTGWTFDAGNTSGFATDKPTTTYYFDQLFIDGVPQTQVTGTPGAGQFSVDHGTDTVTIGTNPAGKTVRMSQYRGLFVSSGRTNLLGIGVRRYANGSPQESGSTSGYAAIYYGGSSAGTKIENCAFVDHANLPLTVSKSDFVINRNVFIRSGKSHAQIGGTTGGDRLRFTANHCYKSNLGNWPAEPTAGAVKIVKTDQGYICDNIIEDHPDGHMLWFDQTNTRCVIARNTIISTPGREGKSGILWEISGGGLLPPSGSNRTQHYSYIVGNTIGACTYASLNVLNSDYTKIWNNTIEGGEDSCVMIRQDNRPTGLAETAPGTYNYNAVTFLSGGGGPNVGVIGAGRSIEFCNNNIGPSSRFGQFIAYNSNGVWPPTANTMFSRLSGNWWQSGNTNGAVAVQWGETNADNSRVSYTLIPRSAGAGALDSRSAFVAASWTNFQGGTEPAASARVEVPADVAVHLTTTTTETRPELEPLFLEAFLTECQDPANRIKGFCWSDAGFNELGGTTSDSDDQALAVLHTALTADYSYRGGAWRGNPTGEIDSIRVTDTTPDVVVPPTDSQTIRRKVEGVWDIYRLRRKTNGVWVDQVVKRISE